MKRITFEPQRTARDWLTLLWLRQVRILWIGPVRIDLSRGR
jgi:hypothetical protein